MSPDLSRSRAYQILRADPAKWDDLNVRIQFLKDWVNAPAAEPGYAGPYDPRWGSEFEERERAAIQAMFSKGRR
jgi:hypothetical protein